MSKKIKITSDNFGDLLVESAKQAVEYSKGKITLKTTSLELPPEPPKYNKNKIKKVRDSLDISQSILAKILSVNVKTVQSWELGTNSPSGPARRLLQMIESQGLACVKDLKAS